MILKRIVVSAYETNCYIVGCPDTRIGVVIDPGDDGDHVIKQIEKIDVDVKYIILTHGHVDHIGAVGHIKKSTGADILIHEKDKNMLSDSRGNLSFFTKEEVDQPKADKILNDGDEIQVGNLTFQIIHTPGHTPGSISIKVKNYLFSGDTLFAGSIGRTDFAGGSYKDIISSIKEKLIILGIEEDIIVLPGHGPETTIEKEKVFNPFLR